MYLAFYLETYSLNGATKINSFLKVTWSLKVPLWSKPRYPVFYIFVHNRSFLVILPNFNLLQTLQRVFFEPLFPRILHRHWFSLFQFLVESWRKWRHFLKNTARIEIIITISTAFRTKKNHNFGPFIRAIFHTYSYYNFNPCGIFEKMTSFSPIFNKELEQGKLMVALNSRNSRFKKHAL